jgi:hypothetical protein
MKRIVGIVLLILGLISAVNVVRQITSKESQKSSGNAAYDRGRAAAKFTPIILLGLGLWLLARSGSPAATPRVVPRPPSHPPGHPLSHPRPASGNVQGMTVPPSLPWFQRKPVVIGLVFVTGLLLLCVLLLVTAGSRLNNRARHLPPPPAPPRFSPPQAPVAGPYKTGQRIEARWAGAWISATVIEPFGPFSYRVQLNDARFPTPIVLSTNLLRP